MTREPPRHGGITLAVERYVENAPPPPLRRFFAQAIAEYFVRIRLDEHDIGRRAPSRWPQALRIIVERRAGLTSTLALECHRVLAH